MKRSYQYHGNKFEDTKIATCIVVLNKNKQTTDIIFRDEENDSERIVLLEEVQKNDYVLSVSRYVQKEEIKQEIDTIATELKARENFLQSLENQLVFSETVYELEKENQEFAEKCKIDYFIYDIEKILWRHKKCLY